MPVVKRIKVVDTLLGVTINSVLTLGATMGDATSSSLLLLAFGPAAVTALTGLTGGFVVCSFLLATTLAPSPAASQLQHQVGFCVCAFPHDRGC